MGGWSGVVCGAVGVQAALGRFARRWVVSAGAGLCWDVCTLRACGLLGLLGAVLCGMHGVLAGCGCGAVLEG